MWPQRPSAPRLREYCSQEFRKQEKPDRFVIFTRYFRLQNVIFKKGPLIKKTSPCLADSKHIFISKIVQVIPKKNGFKKSAGFPFLLYNSATDLG
jgi:hypothetical protein